MQERGITASECYCCILVHFSREFGTIPVLSVKKPEMLRIQRNLFPSYVNYIFMQFNLIFMRKALMTIFNSAIISYDGTKTNLKITHPKM